MKKTSKRILAVVLTLVMAFSVISVGVVSATSTVKANSASTLADGSAVYNFDTVEDAVQYLEETPAVLENNAIAGDTEENIVPTIILPGISQSISYLAEEDGTPAVNQNGDELRGGLLIIDESAIAAPILNNLALPLFNALIAQSNNTALNRTNKELAEGVYKTVQEVFSIQSSDKNGEPVNNLQLVSYYSSLKDMNNEDKSYFYRMIPMQPVTGAVKNADGVYEVAADADVVVPEELIYIYTFPLIGDPMESAEGLDEFIQFVKEDSGYDKVNIASISLGGTILTAYLENMKGTGYPDINNVFNIVACLQGTDVMGDFYLRQFKITGSYDEFFFHEYVPMIMKEMEGYTTLGNVINIALKIFPKSTVYSILTAAMDGLLDTLLINCPQFWSMIPTDRYDEVKAKYNYIWTDSEYAELAVKLDKFQVAKENLYDNLLALTSNGTSRVASVCGYGLDYAKEDYNFFAAMRSSDTTNSDGIIDIDSTSLGATYATAGTLLSDDILFDENAIISPDGSVDASTCLYPNSTWFFQGQHHEVGRNDVVISLMGQLISGKIKSTDDKADEYPQFNGNRNTKHLVQRYIPEAEKIVNWTEDEIAAAEAEAGKTYNRDAIPEIAATLPKAYALLENTICESSEAEAVKDELYNTLVRFGTQEDKTPDPMDEMLEKLLQTIDDVLYAVFGNGGFSDLTR